MDVKGARILVPGATGAIGAALARRLHERGAGVAVAGRDPASLARVAAACGGAPARHFDAYDLDGCSGTVPWAVHELGGLDAVVVCVGVAAFGPAEAVGDTVAEHLLTVNALAPVAVLRAALPAVPPGGALAAVTGVVVDAVPAGMADYAASKAALAAWLTAVRRERRRTGPAVLDIRLPHVESGFAERAVVGAPPALPRGRTVDEAVQTILDALTAAEAPAGRTARTAAASP
ncbi:SDR family oxidoreductase [Streptomyces sp. CC53]|uniref:SDR family NAD(P)-dependent oxidoreductase n=1 Tax=unclassified Streptomyces TaxID=2593676 RepID=UPI0008DD8BFF|nr:MULTISPECIES: SDR family oxidoreductase [unclassified Streptomyces]OII59904.1 SDR family oxidoreductase [Streptomyces sp. CC53]